MVKERITFKKKKENGKERTKILKKEKEENI